MTFKDLWELLTETWNAWSTHKAPQSGATLAYDTPGLLTRCVVLHWALPRAEQHGGRPVRLCSYWHGFTMRHSCSCLARNLPQCTLKPRLPCYQEMAHRFRRWRVSDEHGSCYVSSTMDTSTLRTPTERIRL